jgi:hypothetical protein
VPFVTVLAVLEVPAVGIPDDDDELLDNVVGILGDGGRTATFVTVTRGVSRAALDAGAVKPAVLSHGQWLVLKDVALRELSGRAPVLVTSTQTLRALAARDLVRVAAIMHGSKNVSVELTETGKRVYSRLSVGPFCALCGKPLAFARRVNVAPHTYECLTCTKLGQKVED